MEQDYDDLMRALDVLYICALMVENNLWTPEELSFELNYDDFYEAVVNALHSCCDHVFNDYDDDNQIERYYFSEPVMLEYYRLCREYGSRRGMKLKKNPYYIEAARYVHSLLGGGWTSGYILHTRTNHDCASGILFECNCYFDNYIDLLDAIINIVHFYRNGAVELKAELAQPTALSIIYPTPALVTSWKEAA
jgi:hypothetical protein